jgi:cytochrome c biogenesis protein ResB
MTTSMGRVLRRLLDLLASLRVAVVTMVALALACGIATFYEASHGTAAAQRAFYGTRWFTFLLALLASNVLFSMLKRYPWNRHQAGFVMAHVGILLILGGSLVSLRFGLDGSVALYEGEQAGAVSLRERAVDVELGGRRATFVPDLEAQPPRPDRPLRFAVPGTAVVLVADDYAPKVPRLHVRFDSPAGGTASAWLAWGDSLRADLAEGPVSVTFGDRQAPMPFRIALLEFRSDKYPGSRMAATYESRVRLDEPDGTSSEHVISMNHPLHHRGYVFFQASFVEGQPMMSILSVSRSPGLPLVYAGTALLTVGVAWMFYVKPWLARRQARRAIARRAWAARAAEALS